MNIEDGCRARVPEHCKTSIFVNHAGLRDRTSIFEVGSSDAQGHPSSMDRRLAPPRGVGGGSSATTRPSHPSQCFSLSEPWKADE
jgi:hypothetical protein